MRTRSLLNGAGALVFLSLSSAALAQYRPPPATEAARLTASADETRVSAGEALAGGDKARAKRLLSEALQNYDKALQTDPTHLPAATGFGDTGSALGQHEQVVQRLQPLLQVHPDSVDLAYFVGISLFKLSRAAEGVELLEKASDGAKPEHLLAHFYLGRHHLYEQRPEASIRAFQRYLQQRPEKLARNDHEVLHMLAHAHLMAGQFKDARNAFERAQAGRPESVPLQMGLVAVLEGEGRIPQAIEALHGLASRFPKEPAPRERVGWLLLTTGQFDRAEQAARAALQLQPTATVHQLLGEIALAKDDPKGAEGQLRSALKLNAQLHDARFSLAKAVQRQGRNDDAITLIEEAHRGGVDTVDLWAALGSVYRRAGRFQDAVRAHQNVVKRSPTLARGYVLLAADYYATGEWDLAIEQYGRALKQEATHAGARHWLAAALVQRARVQARVGQLPDATRDLRRALDLNRSATIGRSLGAVLLAQKMYDESAEVLQKSTALPGSSWKDHYLLGYAHLGASRADAALSAFEVSARGATDPAVLSDIYAGWALAKLELGDFDTAVAKLLEPGRGGGAVEIVKNNLPLALIRRALNRIQDGDVDGASKDVESAEKLVPGRSDSGRLARLSRALVEIERGQFAAASASLKVALAGKPESWAQPNAAPLAQAYLDYRQDDIREARKWLKRTGRSPHAPQQSFVTQLDRSLDRREAELAYARGALPVAARAIQAALRADPLNPWVLHNAACVDYRKRKYKEAAETWEKVAQTIPEAVLNLGIDAQVRRRDVAAAVDLYARYVATGGSRAALVGRWKEKLQMIHGIAETKVAPKNGAVAADPIGGAK